MFENINKCNSLVQEFNDNTSTNNGIRYFTS